VTADSTGTARAALTCLDALGQNLRGRGFKAELVRDGNGPGLRVTHGTVPQLADTVYMAPFDGGWWFWWSWADRISPVSDVDSAAFKIAYVLTPYAQ
jgi:hypothetical protein